MSLTSLSNVKTKMGLSVSTYDDVLNALIVQVDTTIKNHLGRSIEEASYTEYPFGYGTKRLRLKEKPVTAITSVRVDTSRLFTASNTLLTVDVDYKLIDGMLFRLNGTWPPAVENKWGLLTNAVVPSTGIIQVVYTAGYSTVPDDIVLAADMLVIKLFGQRKDGEELLSESLEDYSYSRGDSGGDLLKDVRSLLAPYRRIRI